MRRVVIIGGAGAGKSTLARELGTALDLPVHHLDRYFWKPGWVVSTQEEFRERVKVLVEQDRWVIDGNYTATISDRLERADTLVFVDLPLRIRLWRVIKRRLLNSGRTRPDMTEGCPEQIDWEFLKYVIQYGRHRRPQALALVENMRENGMSVVHLRSPAEVRVFLETTTP